MFDSEGELGFWVRVTHDIKEWIMRGEKGNKGCSHAFSGGRTLQTQNSYGSHGRKAHRPSRGKKCNLVGRGTKIRQNKTITCCLITKGGKADQTVWRGTPQKISYVTRLDDEAKMHELLGFMEWRPMSGVE